MNPNMTGSGSKSGSIPTKYPVNARVCVPIEVSPDTITASPTRYDKNGHPNARCVTYAAPAARGYRDPSDAYDNPVNNAATMLIKNANHTAPPITPAAFPINA